MFLQGRPASKGVSETAIEIELWEGFLFRNKSGLHKTLCAYSLDNGPLPGTHPDMLVFRFMTYDWNKNIRMVLEKKNVHYTILRESVIDTLSEVLKKKIHIAEDDPDTLFALSTMLENAGYQIRISGCGKPIMEGRCSRVDLFILDRQMPDVDGLELCRYLRAQSPTKDTPVIMISAQPKTGNEALNAGADDYIEKPFEMHYLLNVVSKYTRLKR